MRSEIKKTRSGRINIGSFLFTYFINLVLSLGWAVPGALLTVAHFFLPDRVPLWCGITALSVWAGVRFLQTLILCGMISLGNSPSANDERFKENKNPYSKKGEYERSLREKNGKR